MKFVLGPIPEDPTFDPDAFGWRSLKEPDPVALNFIALPVAGVMLGILLLFIRWFTTMRTGEVMGPLLIAFVVIIPIHESVHALLTPRFGTTSKTLLGCWPARILFYAYYEGEISRARFIVVLIGPTVMITVVPLLTIALFSLNAPWIASAAVANGIGSAGDLVGLFVMLSQIPRHAVVRNKGWRSYWRPPRVLKTPRLLLRPVESADVDQLHELWLDGDVRKYLWDDEQISRDTAEAVVQANLRDWQESGYGLWMARLRAAGELAGFVGYRSSKERAGPELLFGFHPRYWHMGLASEAVRTALAWAFDWLRVDLVWAATDPPNIASIQLMERLGMRMTHRGLLNGKDAVFYEARSAGVLPSDCGRDGRSL